MNKTIAALEAALAKPEQYDQTALELCDKCGWKTLIPDDCCLNCERNKFEQEPVAWHSHNPDYPIQDGDWVEVIFTSGQPDDAEKWTPLYTAPSKPEQEPVAWWNPITDNASTDPYYRKSKECIPLYTAPQKPDVTFISEGKTWQGLTDDEIELCREKAFSINNPYCPVDRKSMWKAAQYIQAKLREKNT